jgi:nicotinamidase/pyrazinamidase
MPDMTRKKAHADRSVEAANGVTRNTLPEKRAMHRGPLRPGDALVIVDMQNDFVSGSLAVPGGGEVIAVLNRYIDIFTRQRLPVIATRDWHPLRHRSFRESGGNWPAHCVASSAGAAFVPALALPPDAIVISKGTQTDREAYSGFEGTDLDRQLRARGVSRLFIGGLATDYCVLNTVLDARRCGYDVFLLADAIRAVNIGAGDGSRAEAEMQRAGTVAVRIDAVAPEGEPGAMASGQRR